MIVLGLDASGEGAGAAIADSGGVRGCAWAGRGARPAAALLDLADRALVAAGLQRSALEGIAVAVGPGSYAGIRTAVATGKALAWAAGLPLVAIGSLEALACAAGPWPGVTWAALDARRGRVYAAPFRWGLEAPQPLAPPELLEREAFRRSVGTPPGGSLLAGGGVSAEDVAALPGSTLAPPILGPAVPGAVAWLGLHALLAGARADPFALTPLYVSDPVIGPAPAGGAPQDSPLHG